MLTILRNRVYVGENFFRDEWHPAPHPKLIAPELFAVTQAILDERGEDWSLAMEIGSRLGTLRLP